MRKIFAAIVIVGFFGTTLRADAQMTSTNYEIRWDTVGNGGDDTSSSASYILRDTVGNTAVGQGTSSSYDLRAGYRQGVFDQVIDFSFFAQDSSVLNEATSVVGTTISCDTDDFVVGDMVALIQDLGDGQVSAIGKITSIGVGSVAVDDLQDGGTAPVIDGTNDFVALLEGIATDLGTLTDTNVSTAIIGMNVWAEVDGGYVIQVAADGDLSDGVDTIDAVADGDVTAGEEEYGGRSSDTTLPGSTFDSVDTAFTTSFQDIADASTAGYDDRSFLTLKAAIDTNTDGGNYDQALTIIISGNY